MKIVPGADLGICERGWGFGLFPRPPAVQVGYVRKVAERSGARFFWGLLSYFSLIWLHKTLPFFQKNKERKADYYFTEVRDRLFFSTNSVVRLFFLTKTEARFDFFQGRLVYLRCVKL